MITLTVLRTAVARRLGDADHALWSAEEIDGYLTQAYQEVATALGVFWDMLYLENLPRGMSCTQPWERAFLKTLAEGFDYGVPSNYTHPWEAEALDTPMAGPGAHTSPCEATDGFLAELGGGPVVVPEPVSVPSWMQGGWTQA
jgi:hypothetical protein